MSKYLGHLKAVAESDVAALEQAQKHYGDSWMQRGGIGAFMMLARKWDRIERQVEQSVTDVDGIGGEHATDRFDIFGHVERDPRVEGIIDDIRDLRRYLLLVEAHCVSVGMKAAQTVQRDTPTIDTK